MLCLPHEHVICHLLFLLETTVIKSICLLLTSCKIVKAFFRHFINRFFYVIMLVVRALYSCAINIRWPVEILLSLILRKPSAYDGVLVLIIINCFPACEAY